eukprot:10893252-Alexandrium_andersonii.AAC.1
MAAQPPAATGWPGRPRRTPAAQKRAAAIHGGRAGGVRGRGAQRIATTLLRTPDLRCCCGAPEVRPRGSARPAT